MATRSRSSVRVRRSRSVSKMSRSKSPRKMRSKSPRKMASKSPRKMRSKSPRKMRSTRRMARGTRKTRSAPKTEYQKWLKAHAAEITAAWKATGSKKIGDRAKLAKKMAMEAGVSTKPKTRMAKRGTMTRRRRASAVRKFKAGGLSQSAEQKLRALFSRSPSKYTLTKRGSRVMKKRSAKKVKKTRGPKRPANKRAMFFHDRKAEINAEVARRGMKGVRGAFIKVGSEMAKASGY
jgi:hypothetical protein